MPTPSNAADKSWHCYMQLLSRPPPEVLLMWGLFIALIAACKYTPCPLTLLFVSGNLAEFLT